MSKAKTIKRIKAILGDWGGTKLELDCSPCINSIGNGKNNVSQLIERFNVDSVTAITYHDELELGEEDIDYEDLSNELLDEILNIMEEYDVSMSKTIDKCRDENF
jgi:hypothetical protein